MEIESLEKNSLPIYIQIVSNTPGRMRLRVDREHRQPEIMAEITSALKAFVVDIERVRTNVASGSVTIYHTREGDNFDDVLAMLREFGILIQNSPSPKTVMSTSLVGAIARLNQRVNRATEGSADLRFLVPFLMGLFALQQLLSKGERRFKIVPWYTLAWYAFDSFMKLNDTSKSSQPLSDQHKPPGHH
jgi:hypothetical protein